MLLVTLSPLPITLYVYLNKIYNFNVGIALTYLLRYFHTVYYLARYSNYDRIVEKMILDIISGDKK
jgi:hypothetical protein